MERPILAFFLGGSSPPRTLGRGFPVPLRVERLTSERERRRRRSRFICKRPLSALVHLLPFPNSVPPPPHLLAAVAGMPLGHRFAAAAAAAAPPPGEQLVDLVATVPPRGQAYRSAAVVSLDFGYASSAFVPPSIVG